jgi:putative membrane protein
MKKSALNIIPLLFTFVLLSLNYPTTEARQEPKSAFILAASDASTLEVKLGELALKKSPSAKTKEFARSMVNDHGKVKKELLAIATKRNLTIPSGLTLAKQVKYDSLELQKPENFDRMYATIMIRSHEDAVKLFEKQAKSGTDPVLKKWASDNMGMLKHHLEMARSLRPGK